MDRKSGTPVALANEHILCGKRLIFSPNSNFNRLSGIAIMYRWADKNNESVAERLFGGTGFSEQEVASIFMAARNRQRPSRKGTAIVGKSEQRSRMTHIRDFVISGMQIASFKLNPRTDTDKLIALEYRIETTRALFDQNRPSKERRPLKKGLAHESVQLLLAVISPDSDRNPWKHPLVRHRNCILILLFLVTGGRRGDLAKLKVSDIVGGPAAYVRFCAHVDDPADTRIAEPRLKTLPREYPVHPQIANAVIQYVEQHRAAIPNADSSEYLFLATSTGRELALRTINAIFETLQRLIPELTPHVLRHTNTEEVLGSAEALGLTEEKILSTIMWLNGWSTDNVKTYTARKREATARSVASARQEEFFSK
jgi:integrase